MPKKIILGISICLMAPFLFLTGCSYHIANMTMLSTRNVSLDRIDLDKLPRTRGVTGTDTKQIIFIFPIGSPHLATAVEDALDKGKGDLMVDVSVYTEYWWFILAGENSITVRGSVVNTKGVEK